MTYKELRGKIFDYGFETEDNYNDSETIIPNALNSAMTEITNLFPLIEKYEILQYPFNNLFQNTNSVTHYDGSNTISFSAENVKSIYFECSGTGFATVQDDNETRTILFSDRKFVEYRLFATGNVTMTFSGEYSYDIKNVAAYSELLSDKVEDIPTYREWVRYDLKELTKVNGKVTFIDFIDKIKEGVFLNEKTYAAVQDFKLELPSTLLLKGQEKAQYTIFYKKVFTPFAVDTLDDFEIELPHDKAELLPLLTAYYVWLEDDERKSAYYFNQYEQNRNILLQKAQPVVATVEMPIESVMDYAY